MYGEFLDYLGNELQDIKDAGLYKVERKSLPLKAPVSASMAQLKP